MIFICPYNNGITQLVIGYIKKEADKKWIRESFINYESFASIFEAFYQIMISHNEIKIIEDLTADEKEKYWNQALEFDTTRNKRIKIAKSLYVIEKVFEIKI